MDGGISMHMKVAVTFKGSNYLVWSRMVRTTVGSKGLWKHLTDGEAPQLITQGEDSEEAIQITEEGIKTTLGDQTLTPSSRCLRKTVTLMVIPLVHQ
ncbi:hypothetical protein F2Q68_00010063 [Brassica cretica]|uniref:Uncharacterized protein n=1 Tax=Brassica cretica TaxID=69181 RepID=A0A8S9L1C1_BRACR|nr:hypothetical protein F2Q68_00010063 [Brassica cretica]